MKLTAIKYGETTLSRAMIFRGGDPQYKERISLLFYLIEQADRRILVDVGCDTMPGFELRHFCGPITALQTYGITADQITDVVITHAHGDHIDALHYFENATLWIQQQEYHKGLRYIPPKMRVHTFETEITVAEGVRARCIGGHSAGSSIVLAESGEKVYVLCGDECYSKVCLTQNIPTGSSINPQRSEAFIEMYRNAPYVSCIFHDADILPGENGYCVISE